MNIYFLFKDNLPVFFKPIGIIREFTYHENNETKERFLCSKDLNCVFCNKSNYNTRTFYIIPCIFSVKSKSLYSKDFPVGYILMNEKQLTLLRDFLIENKDIVYTIGLALSYKVYKQYYISKLSKEQVNLNVSEIHPTLKHMKILNKNLYKKLLSFDKINLERVVNEYLFSHIFVNIIEMYDYSEFIEITMDKNNNIVFGKKYITEEVFTLDVDKVITYIKYLDENYETAIKRFFKIKENL